MRIMDCMPQALLDEVDEAVGESLTLTTNPGASFEDVRDRLSQITQLLLQVLASDAVLAEVPRAPA